MTAPAAAAKATPTGGVGDAAGGPARRPSVLVADDEFVISRCVSFMLKKEGFDCRTAADGRAALAAVRDAPPDLVILDLDMPGLDGFEVCAAIRADPALTGVLVLVLTAKGQPMSRDWASRIAADDFMLKPFDPRALLQRVHGLLDSRCAVP